MGEADIIELVRRLRLGHHAVLSKLPYDADPVRRIAARPFGSTWRKASHHTDYLPHLEELGIVERTVSRGETLWRLTKPLGHEIRRYLDAKDPAHV